MIPLAPGIRVGPPADSVRGGDQCAPRGASGARVTHDSAGAVADLATDIDE
jgi:hypothetical protein